MIDFQHITEPEFTRAASGLLSNAMRLVIAGEFEAADSALEHFIRPGPWKLKKQGRLIDQVGELWPKVKWARKQSSPAMAKHAAMTFDELDARLAEEAAQYQAMLKVPIRNQLKPAGRSWSAAYFQSLLESADKKYREQEFSGFCIDAEFVLKSRLASHRQANKHAGLVGGLLSALNLGEKGESPANFNILDFLQQTVPIEVDPAAASISNDALCDFTRTYMKRYAVTPVYTTHFVFQATLVLSLAEGARATAIKAVEMLAVDDHGCQALMSSLPLPHVAALFRSGDCAASVGVDKAIVAKYLHSLESRPMPPNSVLPFPGRKSATSDDVSSFTRHLAGTPLAGRDCISLPILDTPERAYIFQCTQSEVEAIWREARNLVPVTNRWPLVTSTFGGGDSFAEKIKGADFFSRFYFEEAPDVDDTSPAALIRAADDVDLDKFLAEKARERSEDFDLEEDLEYQLEYTAGRYGSAPDAAEIRKARINGKPIANSFELERWLLDWEQRGNFSVEPDMEPDGGYQQEPVILMFLPTPNPWDALAYLHFFGAYDGSEHWIALGRRWQAKYGAELYAHFGTMLECFVQRPPKNLDDAWTLATEHYLAAPCTLDLPGYHLRQYAEGLVGAERWFLHERP